MERGAGRSTEYRVSLALLRVGLAALAALMLLNRQPAQLHALIAANEDDEILYVDPDGFIHVVDPRPSSTELQVQWVSPDGGWAHIAAGDFNADGDAEIAAVRRDGEGSLLAVFDPVAPNIPEGHDRFVAGVPWDLLYSRPVSSAVSAVTSGDFDPDRPGDEILFSRFLPEDERRDGDFRGRVTILRQPSEVTSGREWEEMATYDSEFDWTWAASGNVDGEGQDEVALVDDNTGTLSVLRVNLAGRSLIPFFRNSNRDHTWLRAAIGQYEGGGPEEVGAVRDAEFPLPSFWIFRYENGALVDHQWEAFLPSPSMIFFGDLTGNGDEEAIILRSVRPEAGARARLIIRDNGNDSPGMREALLDGDNGYLTGAAGDIDADGRDEIAIMRDYRIRIYTQPEINSAYEELLTPTNSDDIAVGNVDAHGLASAPQRAARLHLPYISSGSR